MTDQPTGGPSRGAILVVDDEEQVRRLMVRVLSRRGYECAEASDAPEAREQLDGRPFDLVITDMLMPGETGLSLARHVLSTRPDTAVVMASVTGDPAVAEGAVELGAYGYLVKPFEADELVIAVTNALRRRSLEIENRNHRRHLQRQVYQRTAALERTVLRLKQAETETVQLLGAAAEFRDGETGEHIERVARYCQLLSAKVGLPPERSDLVALASPMHDVGKIGIPDGVLFKPGKLTKEEFNVVMRHAEIGHRLLADSRAELLQIAATIAWTHHEKWDGTGYPQGLAGAVIPLEGRVTSIADVFDALLSRRVYKPAFPADRTMEIMRAGREKHFDPDMLDVFLGEGDDFLAINMGLPDRSEVEVS